MTPSHLLIVVALVAAANPGRLAPALPRGPRHPRRRAAVSGAGAVGVSAVLVGLAVAGDMIVDALSVNAPTMRLAAGLVLAAGALRDTFVAPPSPEPALGGGAAALVPVAVPLLLRPEVALVAVSAGADDRVGAVVVALVVICVAVAGAAAMPLPASAPSVARRVLHWLGRLGGGLGALAGIALAVSGVLDV